MFYLGTSNVIENLALLFTLFFVGLFLVGKFPSFMKENKLRKLKLADSSVQSFVDSYFVKRGVNPIRQFRENQGVLVGMLLKYRNLCKRNGSAQKQKLNLESMIMEKLNLQQVYCRNAEKLILDLKNQYKLKSLVRYRNDCAKQVLRWTNEEVPESDIHINLEGIGATTRTV